MEENKITNNQESYDEYEEIKKRKLEKLKELQEKVNKQIQMELALDSALSQILTRKAKERLSNIKLVNKEKYMKVAQYLLYLYKLGKITTKIDDDTLKKLLLKLFPPKSREIKIRRI